MEPQRSDSKGEYPILATEQHLDRADIAPEVNLEGENAPQVYNTGKSNHAPQVVQSSPMSNGIDEKATVCDDPEEGKKYQRVPFGLSALLFGLLIALITTVVVGGAVGGGIGGSCKSFSSSGATTTTSLVAQGSPSTAASSSPSALVDYMAPEPSSVTSLLDNCNSLPSTISGPGDSSYKVTCGTDFLSDVPDVNTGQVLKDVTGLFAYSLEDCVDACWNLNVYRDSNGYNTTTADPNVWPRCGGVTWRNDMATSARVKIANCFLKNGSSRGEICTTCASAAVLVEGTSLGPF